MEIPVHHPALVRLRGFYLLELLISLTVGAVILNGMIVVLMATRLCYSHVESWSHLQENGRFATYFLRQAIQSPVQGYPVTGDSDAIRYHARLSGIETVMFIADTHRKNKRGEKIYGLYRRRQGKRAEELVDGIDSLKIHYGIPRKDGILDYLTSDQIASTQWRKVRSVKLAVKVNSVQAGAY